MILSKKIMLLPTKEQEILMKKSVGVARWSYNYMISRNKDSEIFFNQNVIRKEITKLKQKDEYSWLREVSSNIPKQACKDCQKAFYDCSKQEDKEYPNFKKKGVSNSFYVNYESFHKTQNGCHCEKLGNIKTVEEVPDLEKYLEPRIVFDGKYWYITFSYETFKKFEHNENGRTIGIDLGVKTFVVTSDGDYFANINKSRTCKILYRRLKLLQRKLARCKRSSNNRKKIKQQIELTHRRLKNIRNDYIHQITTYLVKTKPKKIVVEYLRVSNMVKNRKLSRVISECGFFKFRNILEYKCELYSIDFQLADQFYPSSKLCSNCGYKKVDLTLSDRVYKCDCCGLSIDRDLNAALNLSYL